MINPFCTIIYRSISLVVQKLVSELPNSRFQAHSVQFWQIKRDANKPWAKGIFGEIKEVSSIWDVRHEHVVFLVWVAITDGTIFMKSRSLKSSTVLCSLVYSYPLAPTFWPGSRTLSAMIEWRALTKSGQLTRKPQFFIF